MNIATAVFTFNRPRHTSMLLNSIKNNHILPDKLIIFHDGPKDSTDLQEWNEVQRIISEVDWCNREIVVSERNKGLADSIVSGVTSVLSRYDAIIVLEDDCICHPQFMEFMNKGLEIYQDDTRVYSVSGYCDPVYIKRDTYSVYFTGRISTLGWGTWTDRWKEFERDYGVLRRIKRDGGLLKAFHTWGEDLEQMLLDSASGYNDSWGCLWALHVIEKEGYNVSPYESLIDNCGFDGSGVHCDKNKPLYILQEGERDFLFPKQPFFREDVKEIISDYFSYTPTIIKERSYKQFLIEYIKLKANGETISSVLLGKGVRNVAIWGKNQIADIIIDEIQKDISIEYIIVSAMVQTEEYKGIPIVGVDKLNKEIEAVIVIPYYDLSSIRKKCDTVGYGGYVIGIDQLVIT